MNGVSDWDILLESPVVGFPQSGSFVIIEFKPVLDIRRIEWIVAFHVVEFLLITHCGSLG
jgi:hypothetical protein